jgi:type II secretory pathway component GspD/PulD (secretin)
MANTKAQNDTKIPYLGDIPLIGNLFKRRQRSDLQTELIIFLTPHIVQAPSQLVALSASERQKADLHRSFTEEELNKMFDGMPVKGPEAHPEQKHPLHDPGWPEPGK